MPATTQPAKPAAQQARILRLSSAERQCLFVPDAVMVTVCIQGPGQTWRRFNAQPLPKEVLEAFGASVRLEHDGTHRDWPVRGLQGKDSALRKLLHHLEQACKDGSKELRRFPLRWAPNPLSLFECLQAVNAMNISFEALRINLAYLRQSPKDYFDDWADALSACPSFAELLTLQFRPYIRARRNDVDQIGTFWTLANRKRIPRAIGILRKWFRNYCQKTTPNLADAAWFYMCAQREPFTSSFLDRLARSIPQEREHRDAVLDQIGHPGMKQEMEIRFVALQSA